MVLTKALEGQPSAMAEADDDGFADWQIAVRPIGRVNWLGLWTLYLREVRRFLKMLLQTIMAPVITSLLFLAIFTLAFGRQIDISGLSYSEFLTPGLIMMAVMQQAFANSSSSLIAGKIVGNIVDTLMAPLGSAEILIAYVLSGVTRALIVAFGTAFALSFFVGLPNFNWLWGSYFVVMGAMVMSLLGIMAGLWAEKFDHLSTVTNFVITPLAFMSGTFYSIQRLPGFWQDLAHINPLFYMIDGFRFAAIGWSDTDPWSAALVVAATAVICTVWCFRLLKIGYKLTS
jgi:ABC-2 type transport system permease protein